MSIESWIVQARRKTCLACEKMRACDAGGIIHSIFAEETRCPLGLHPARLDAVAARAWPANAPRASNCCGSPLDG